MNLVKSNAFVANGYLNILACLLIQLHCFDGHYLFLLFIVNKVDISHIIRRTNFIIFEIVFLLLSGLPILKA